jgi:hypothetical protein
MLQLLGSALILGKWRSSSCLQVKIFGWQMAKQYQRSILETYEECRIPRVHFGCDVMIHHADSHRVKTDETRGERC